MPVGYWCPVLHAHLPYVRHPEYPAFLEEDWLFEAMTETYVPIVRVLDGLLRDGVDYRLTMTLSPPLVSMMTDELLIGRYLRHLDSLIELSRREIERTSRWQPHFTDIARFYHGEFQDVRRIFREEYGGNLLGAFRKHCDAGKLEIITCGATHGFLPLMDPVPQAVRAQVHVAAQHYRQHFGRDAQGIWLPECGYLPGHEVYLKEVGLRYASSSRTGSRTPTRGRASASTRPSCRPAGSCSSAATWSRRARCGAPSRAIRATSTTASSTGTSASSCRWGTSRSSCPTGCARTSGSSTTASPAAAPTSGTSSRTCARGRSRRRRSTRATSWATGRSRSSASRANYGRPPIVVSPYDAELFGHWWFEGPQFLDFLFRKMHHDQDVVKAVTPSEYLAMFPDLEVCQPPMCTWGAKGYAEVWLNASNDWIYPHLDMAAERMVELARRFEQPSAIEWRALNQAARELLLAQSSDWAFIMKTNTTVEYAKKRTRDHIARFDYLYRSLTGDCMLEEAILGEFEERDNIFPQLDYRVYR